ncbi:hypothetical protein ACJ73_01166 [Blastomyces percursus]|uniref:Uncharacterized protein n=1 Tax=Blastomyces percursus TaxID=1658174 RepID=A0A1J9QF37_9EURO|nr:hypothetical protein ACJ73_01166 [Blastomyces percursus]
MEERAEQEQVEHMERLRNQEGLFEAEDYPEEVDKERVAQAQDKPPGQDMSAQTENASKRITQLDLRNPAEIGQDGRCSVVERLVIKYRRKGFVPCDKDSRDDGTNTVLLVPAQQAASGRQLDFVSNRFKPAEQVAKKSRL